MGNQPQNPVTTHLKRHYIVVVHGMGEQKINVTAPAVVERFAEARHSTEDDAGDGAAQKRPKASSKSPDYHFIIPANLSEQTVRNNGYGHGWAEFENIPVKKPASSPPLPEFDGSIATKSCGNNFRFVDIDWQFILRSDIETFGSPTEKWSKALLERLEHRQRQLRKAHKKTVAAWAIPMLRSMVNTALPLKKILSLNYADLTKLVFDGFLGDVHLYGDFGRTRGRAVRHFHVVLDEIMIRDFLHWHWVISKENPEQQYQPPEFTIIAHSLGTIMSFDALVYAHIRDDIRRNNYASQQWPESLPFPGYDFMPKIEEKNWDYLHGKMRDIWTDKQTKPETLDIIREIIPNANELFKEDSFQTNGQSKANNKIPAPDIPYLSWKKHIKNYITLGSPIDKFYVLWPDNYAHLDEKPKEGQDDFLASSAEINHYNFCDEQDPVGHHLEEVMSTRVYNKLFKSDPTGNHDVVFRRYGVPGFAHVKYFNDKKLFLKIIDHIIDQKKPEHNNSFLWQEIHENKLAFKSAKRWAYYLIPLIASLATTALVSYGVMNDSLLWRWLSLIAAVLLWVQPNLLTAYTDEAIDSRKMAHSWLEDKWNKIRPVRGIFSRLVSAAIEWRRILIVESLGSNTVPVDDTPYDVSERIAFQSQEMTDKPLKYFALLVTVATLSLAGSLALGYTLYYPVEADKLLHIHVFTHLSTISGPWLNAEKIAFFFTLSYSFVRFYVAFSFLTAWHKCKPEKHKQ
ncbi:MAG TPA: hypothetical protein ENL07_04570 [Chlorobaculum parvum]|uniref:Uncharacterized protein n=1 Tax=Chlorobaculum parvum TaxID=274539 RepID=A0A7C5HHC6_9CHLB|nr:hypothetical protein [Chlorobaculum parvum]